MFDLDVAVNDPAKVERQILDGGVYTTRLGSEIGLTMYNHVKWRQKKGKCTGDLGVCISLKETWKLRDWKRGKIYAFCEKHKTNYEIFAFIVNTSNIITSNIWRYEVILNVSHVFLYSLCNTYWCSLELSRFFLF